MSSEFVTIGRDSFKGRAHLILQDLRRIEKSPHESLFSFVIPLQECCFVFINSFLVIKIIFWDSFDQVWWWFDVEIHWISGKKWKISGNFQSRSDFQLFLGFADVEFQKKYDSVKIQIQSFQMLQKLSKSVHGSKSYNITKYVFFGPKKTPFEELN